MEHFLWYHGTTKENADKILVEGFREYTHFTPDLASALSMGGAYVFSVYFEEPPSSYWQWVTPSLILPDRILSLRCFGVELLYFNPDEDRKLHHAGLIRWYKETNGQDVQVCTTCDGYGETGIIHDGTGLLPHGSSGRTDKANDSVVCPDCRGHGVDEYHG